MCVKYILFLLIILYKDYNRIYIFFILYKTTRTKHMIKKIGMLRFHINVLLYYLVYAQNLPDDTL